MDFLQTIAKQTATDYVIVSVSSLVLTQQKQKYLK